MKKILLLLVFSCLMQPVFCQEMYDVTPFIEAYNEFIAAIKNKDVDIKDAGTKAIKQINKAHKPFKKYGWCDASYYSARVYNEMKEFDKALAELDGCTPKYTRLDEIELRAALKGKIFDRLDKYELALEAYLKAQAAYEQQTHSNVSFYHYANPIHRMYSGMGDYENAIKYNYLCDSVKGIKSLLSYIYHQRLAEKNGSSNIKWEELFKKAREYDSTGNRTAAYEKYTEAITLNDLYADAYYYRGLLGLKMRRYTEASKDLIKCFNELNYQFPRLQFLTYISLEATGDFNDNYYNFYDTYPASERTSLLREFGITGSAKFVSKETRNNDAARQARIRDEQAQLNRSMNNTSSNATQNTTEKRDCICSFCSGTGTMRIKSIEVYYPDVVNSDGKVVGRSSYSKTRTVYEDLTCTRCLGTGKCK